MFLLKLFKTSFNFKEILKNSNQKIWQIIIYFIILIFIANFPQTLNIVKNDGSRLDFVIEDFESANPNDWDIPHNITISGGKLHNNGDLTRYVNEHKGITYIINNNESINVNDYKNHIILSESSIIYIDKEGNYLEEFGYRGFTDIFRFSELDFASGDEKIELFNLFAKSMEKSFAKPIVLFTILRNISTQLLTNIIYVLILALLIQLFRFGYQNFMSFIDSVKFIVLSLGLPSVLTFIIGLLEPAFTPVVFQISSGITVMLVMLIFGRRTFG